LIDPQYSYIRTNENGGGGTHDHEKKTSSTWRVNYKYTFDSLATSLYVPFTIEELLTGEMEPVECELQGRLDGYAGMFSGKVDANYRMDSVVLNVTNSEGEEVYNETMFVTPEKFYDEEDSNTGNQKAYINEFYMANFGVAVKDMEFTEGETYNYTVTARLYTGDNVVVNESSFCYGEAS